MAPQLTHNLDGIIWVLDYDLALHTGLKETGIWESAFNKTPGASGMLTNCITNSKMFSGNQKCFNCNEPHHLSLCTKPKDLACIKQKRKAHTTTCRASLPPMDPKWRAPEPEENNKHIIDNVSYTYNNVTNCWDKDANLGTGASSHLATTPGPACAPPAAGQVIPPTQPDPSPTNAKAGCAFLAGFQGTTIFTIKISRTTYTFTASCFQYWCCLYRYHHC